MNNGLFRREHPLLFGLIVLGGMGMIFWAGVALFILRLIHPSQGDLFPPEHGIGVIELKGVMISAEEVLADLADFRNDDAVKAVIIRIDTPGGAVGAAQEIFTDIQRTAKIKPVVASMASVAASGGYYAALGANSIYANPGTMTGSIGVIIEFANLEKIFDKVGYQTEVIKSGVNKDIGSMARAMTPEERSLLQATVDDVYLQFIQAVAACRKMDLDAVRPLADGRIFTGSQALELGLIDQLGNFTDAIEQAMELAGLKGEEPNLIYPEAKNFSLLQLLTGQASQSAIKLLLPKAPTLLYQWTMPAQ